MGKKSKKGSTRAGKPQHKAAGQGISRSKWKGTSIGNVIAAGGSSTGGGSGCGDDLVSVDSSTAEMVMTTISAPGMDETTAGQQPQQQQQQQPDISRPAAPVLSTTNTPNEDKDEEEVEEEVGETEPRNTESPKADPELEIKLHDNGGVTEPSYEALSIVPPLQTKILDSLPELSTTAFSAVAEAVKSVDHLEVDSLYEGKKTITKILDSSPELATTSSVESVEHLGVDSPYEEKKTIDEADPIDISVFSVKLRDAVKDLEPAAAVNIVEGTASGMVGKIDDQLKMLREIPSLDKPASDEAAVKQKDCSCVIL